ncbi:MAG: hypothetical protein ABFD83_07305 [Armatimonadota bacterium]
MRNTVIVLTIALLLVSIVCAWSDETAAVAPDNAAISPDFKYEIPSVTPDTQVFRRTPVIDGTVEDGEWDTYYTFEVPGWNATTFADWDSNCMYAAVKSNRPLDFLVVLDCGDDGWFHGEDNYEFRTTRGTDGSMNLAVSRYESKNTKLPIALPVSQEEASMVTIKSSKSDDSYVIELCIPSRLIKSLKFGNGRQVGLQLAVNAGPDETGWVPNNELGDTKGCTLVDKKIVSLKPLELGFDLRDSVIARGDDVVGKLHITNGGNETVDVRSYLIAGEGKAGKYMSSEMTRLESIPPGQHLTKDYRATVLSDMSSGSWALGAEVKSSTGRLGSAIVSFDVVDPFEIESRLPDRDVRADVKDVTVGVVIMNNRRSEIKGSAKVIFPTGWEVWRGLDTRMFKIGGRSSSAVSFKAKPPLGAIGEVPIKMEVTSNGETKSVEGTIRIVNP